MALELATPEHVGIENTARYKLGSIIITYEVIALMW